MKYALTLVSLLILSLLAFVPLALADVAPAQKDVVSTAVGDGRFEVLAAALNQAGLIDALRSDGPFTVFAPTDEAFAALPEGVVAGLLEPGNRDALKRVLTAHVVAGRVMAADLLPVRRVETLAGAHFPVGLRIGNASVVQADVACSNGVIHVIDAVLIPPAVKEKRVAVDAMAIIYAAIEKGVPLFNGGDVAGCAAVYHQAAEKLARADRDSITDFARWDLEQTLRTASEDPSERAWAIRHAFDRMLADGAFEPRMEASLPKGFPGAGPVGQVVRKSYPRYRAARAASARQNGAFWTLFQHIKKNKVEMTAPVEMTMDGDMRMRDMAFLYEAPTQGAAGRQGSVDVLDLDRTDVLSIGMRGERSEERIAIAKRLVEARMKDLGLEAAGDWRLFGYNSPMVSSAKRFWELQVPVSRR